MEAEVNNAARSGQHGAEVRITAASQANDFAANAIFLRREFQCHEGRTEQLGVGGSGVGEGQIAQEEADVAELERLRGSNGAGVLPRPQEEKEGQTNHVGTGEESNVVGVEGLGHDVPKDGNRNGLHAVGRGVMLGIMGKHTAEAKVDISLDGETRVRGPHTRERLPNAA